MSSETPIHPQHHRLSKPKPEIIAFPASGIPPLGFNLFRLNNIFALRLFALIIISLPRAVLTAVTAIQNAVLFFLLARLTERWETVDSHPLPFLG
jgi:hypothetical protein